MTYGDQRLAVIYDLDNPDGSDHDYFRSLVDDANAEVVTDLGCGTGILTVTLTRPGRRVVGIDPAPAMLARAASRPGGGGVDWLLGTSEQIRPDSTDVALMSGNVAMHILGDEWHETLHRIASWLRPGGLVAFDTRNPAARAWEHWNDPLTERDTPVGRLRESVATDPPDDSGVVTMHCYNEFSEDGSIVAIDQQLQFRSFDQVCTDLSAAGLRVINVWGDWRKTVFDGAEKTPLMVFEAVKDPTS